MQLEIKLKYYNSSLKIGFNNLRENVYDVANEIWLPASVHNGMLVYGNSRIHYTKIKAGIDINNFIAQQYCPF